MVMLVNIYQTIKVIPKLVQEMNGDLWQHTSHELFMLLIVLMQKYTNLIAATRLPNFTKPGVWGCPLTSIICIAGEIRNTNSMLAR